MLNKKCQLLLLTTLFHFSITFSMENIEQMIGGACTQLDALCTTEGIEELENTLGQTSDCIDSVVNPLVTNDHLIRASVLGYTALAPHLVSTAINVSEFIAQHISANKTTQLYLTTLPPLALHVAAGAIIGTNIAQAQYKKRLQQYQIGQRGSKLWYAGPATTALSLGLICSHLNPDRAPAYTLLTGGFASSLAYSGYTAYNTEIEVDELRARSEELHDKINKSRAAFSESFGKRAPQNYNSKSLTFQEKNPVQEGLQQFYKEVGDRAANKFQK